MTYILRSWNMDGRMSLKMHLQHSRVDAFSQIANSWQSIRQTRRTASQILSLWKYNYQVQWNEIMFGWNVKTSNLKTKQRKLAWLYLRVKRKSNVINNHHHHHNGRIITCTRRARPICSSENCHRIHHLNRRKHNLILKPINLTCRPRKQSEVELRDPLEGIFLGDLYS